MFLPCKAVPTSMCYTMTCLKADIYLAFWLLEISANQIKSWAATNRV